MKLTAAEVKKKLALACRILGTEGHDDLNLGHVSTRAPDRQDLMYMKGRGLCLSEIHEEDLVTIDFAYKKIDGSRNPYSPEDEDYFDTRLARKMESDLKGRRKLAWLWYWQEGLCPCCNQKITKETGWHIHHVVKRSQGGSDTMGNLQLLHPNCHRQHHANE